MDNLPCWNCGKTKAYFLANCEHCGAAWNGAPAPIISDISYDVPLPPSDNTALSPQTPGPLPVISIQKQAQPPSFQPIPAINVTVGRENSRDIKLSFTDRPLGVVLLGQTGFGKTSLMEHLIAADIGQTTNFIFDPHGEVQLH